MWGFLFVCGMKSTTEAGQQRTRTRESPSFFFTMDARDILGIDPSAAGAAAPRPRASKPQIKKPEGMSREVFALLVQDAREGRTQIPVVPTAADNFKEKRHRVIGWEWREFTNAGRSDGLTLHHWSKMSDKSTVYHFAKFNKKVKVLDWSADEYQKHLTHPSWDEQETSALFDLWCVRNRALLRMRRPCSCSSQCPPGTPVRVAARVFFHPPKSHSPPPTSSPALCRAFHAAAGSICAGQ